MSPERSTFDIDRIKASVNLLEVAGHYTQLTRYSRATGEYAGPCPRCGGEDRFHVVETTQKFYCRNCTPRGGDVIDLIRLVHEVDFREACRLLGAGDFSFSERQEQIISPPPGRESADAVWQNSRFQESAQRTIYATHELLLSQEGSAGKEYLQSRGLDEETWRAYNLGYGQNYHPVRHQQMDAIFIPWVEPGGDRITAIQHRFIDPTLSRGERYIFKPGSSPILFGTQVLRPAETLVVLEGEFNCMALRQTGVQTLSVGAETNALNDHTLSLLQGYLPNYQQLLVWFDDPAYAQEMAERLATEMPFRKKVRPITSDLDANDLLVAGELRDMVVEYSIR